VDLSNWGRNIIDVLVGDGSTEKYKTSLGRNLETVNLAVRAVVEI
jgi:hypothetical protein